MNWTCLSGQTLRWIGLFLERPFSRLNFLWAGFFIDREISGLNLFWTAFSLNFRFSQVLLPRTELFSELPICLKLGREYYGTHRHQINFLYCRTAWRQS